MVHLKFATYVILIPMNTLSDMLHVWNMYQHLPQKSPSFVGKNIYQHHGSHLSLVIKQGVLENEPISSRIFPAIKLHWCWIFLLMFEHQRVNPDVFIAIEIPVRSYNFPIKPMKPHEIPFSSLFISLFNIPIPKPKNKRQRRVPPFGTRWEAVLEFDHESILFGPWSPSEQALSHGRFPKSLGPMVPLKIDGLKWILLPKCEPWCWYIYRQHWVILFG